jgi:hypothetical protein
LDFTIKTYRSLLNSLIAQGYSFQAYADFLDRPLTRAIILRHDVEANYGNALAFAQIQHELKVMGTYYFRFLPNHFSIEIIQLIAAFGHEIGYHYDDLSHCKGDYDKALHRFEKNLETLRKIADVKTICMEGAPLSKYDNRDLWNTHSPHASPLTLHYRDYGIIGEPYFDTDFSRVLYLTDTGRRWDGEKVSVRDKVGGQRSAVSGRQSAVKMQNAKCKMQNAKFHSTSDIITAAHAGLLPDQIMFTFHPQRWTDKPLPWLKELVLQNVKNVVKRIVLGFKD